MTQAYTDSSLNKNAPGQLMQLVGFVIGKDRFALDILMVQEIMKTTTITNLPNSPDFIEGVINLRGSIIPVIDLSRRLNLPLQEESSMSKTRIIITNVNNQITGFMVDSVSKVLKIQESSIEPPPDIVTAGLESQYIFGVSEIDGRLVTILDFSRILEAGEIKRLKNLAEN